ncbi:MAG: signal peptidase I [Deltaproteobacteria bacterium]|nr:signal peptidase I [Deltaproteobacteria bacterium]MBW2383371.1 signal peptidase I [Deltaproteobacteria bacterium]MBW2696399.1 signal peptidase I [Deltaproteobacteria bacterium]
MTTDRQESGAQTPGDDRAVNAEPPRSIAGRIWEQVGTLVLAILIAVGIRTFVIEPFRIPSGSMLPTLLIGDHLFVNKFVFGPRIPFTEIRLPGLRDPERGDVVVFEVARGEPPRTPTIAPADKYPDLRRDDFVKRIVGLPGDRISVADGHITVNDVAAEQIASDRTHVDERGTRLRIHSEILGDCVHAVLDDPHRNGPEKHEFVVPEGRYFMVGDNRDYSNDSRNWGTVRLEEMKGPAFILYWSWSVNGNALQFFNPANWFTAEKRWDRVFSRVRCDRVGDEAELESPIPAQATPAPPLD